MKRPAFLDDRYLNFLANLDETRRHNMIYAIGDILTHYPELNASEAQAIFRYWYCHTEPLKAPEKLAV